MKTQTYKGLVTDVPGAICCFVVVDERDSKHWFYTRGGVGRPKRGDTVYITVSDEPPRLLLAAEEGTGE